MRCQLGNIQFDGLIGFDQFDIKESINYSEHSVIEGKPRLQKVGDNLDEISVSILFHKSFCEPEQQYAALRTNMKDGEILPLVLGNGRVIGSFVISELSSRYEQTTPKGDLISLRVDMTLKEFFEPIKEEEEVTAAVPSFGRTARRNRTGFANTNNTPTTSDISTAPQNDISAAGPNITAAGADTTSLDKDLTAAEIDPNKADSLLRKIDKKLDQINSDISNAIARINNTTGQIYTETRDLESALLNMISKAQAMQSFTSVFDLVNSRLAYVDLMISLNNVRATSQILAAFIAMRR